MTGPDDASTTDRQRRISRRSLGLGLVTGAAGTGALVLATGREADAGAAEMTSSGDLQALLDAAPPGGVVALPAGVVVRVTEQVTISVPRVTLTGPGQLVVDGGPADGTALRVTGEGCRIVDVTVENPDGLFERGVEVAAHDVVVSGCLVRGFRYGVVVAADGEWLGTQVLGNRVLDVGGAGGGPGSDSREGEDRGDGITVWGARATVVGNIVTAAQGADARIGIHAEGLGDIEVDSPPESSSMVTISGNVVSGPFRRAIALEEVSQAVVSGNTVADATWWSLAVIGGRGCVVSDNAVRYSRGAGDDQGSAYSPPRSAVLVFGGRGHRIAGNTITVTGRADAFVTVSTLRSDQPTDVVVDGNTCTTDGDGVAVAGVVLAGTPGPVRATVRANTLVGMTDLGIYLGEAVSIDVSDNSVVGAPRCARGIVVENAVSRGSTIRGNRLSGCDLGVGAFAQSAGAVTSNVLQDCTTGIDLFASDGLLVQGNIALDTGTAVANADGNTVS